MAIICSDNKKQEKFFEMLFSGIENKNQENLGKCCVALQAFLNRPKTKLKKQIQAIGVSTSTDFPIVTKDSFNVTVESQNFDMGWERAFREIPLGQNQDAWEIYNAANSLTFTKVQEGQRIDVAGYTGSKVTAYVDHYGGAIGWTDKMIRYRKVAAMLDLAETFRNKFWTNKANNFYALMAAAAALNVTPWQGATGDGQLQQDIQTINQGAFNVTNRNKDKGYGDTANAPLLMYYNPIDKNRILAAFTVTTASLAAAGRTGVTINYNITPIPTYNQFISGGAPILCLPGQKSQKAEGMPPTTYGPELDILSLNRVQAVWAIYGGVIADTDQYQLLTLG